MNENRTGLECKEVLVTPEMAKSWLESSPGNPRWKNGKMYEPSSATRLSNQLKNNQWYQGTNLIGIREDGTLAEGHHRCAAIVQAGVPVYCWVMFGIKPENELHIDDNKRRWDANLLGVNASIAAVAPVEFAMKNNVSTSHARSYMTIEQKKKFLDDHPLVVDAYYISVKGESKRYRLTGKKAGCIHAIFCALECGIDKEQLSEMFYSVNTGIYRGDRESAAIFLRNTLMSKDRSDPVDLSNITQQAIRDYVNGTLRQKIYIVSKDIKGVYFIQREKIGKA